jgi:hypothetical protein
LISVKFHHPKESGGVRMRRGNGIRPGLPG